jgi:hypothetical protein
MAALTASDFTTNGISALFTNFGLTFSSDKATHDINWFYTSSNQNSASSIYPVTKGRDGGVYKDWIGYDHSYVAVLAPVISANSGSFTVNYHATATQALSVTASTTDGGTLSYQWYSNTTDSTAGATAITTNGTSATYNAPRNTSTTSASKTTWYYCIVTNTKSGATATTRSLFMYVTVRQRAAAPTISTHPASNTGYAYNATPTALSVVATGSGTLSYQWYYNTSNSNSGGTALSGQTSSTYTPPTNTSRYYYCVVTNTLNETSASTTSNVAQLSFAGATAVAPTITTQPSSYTVNYHATTTQTLTIAATASDGGTLSYQWYYNTSNSNSGGTAIIPSGTSTTYNAPRSTADNTRYYYCIVTNTKDGATATTTSNVVYVTVRAKAVAPTITTQPSSYTVNYHATATQALTIAATASDSGSLTYQWYSNTSNSNSGGTAITTSGTSATYNAPRSTADNIKYYYCIVTNTKNETTASTTSSVASVAVRAKAVAPTITTQPTSKTTTTDTAVSLTIAATASDSGTLSYQWYSNTSNSNSGGTSLSGATNATYSPPVSSAGTVYYYCTVTNTKNETTASTTSSVASVVVSHANAVAPVITLHPVSETVNGYTTPANPLVVIATASDGGTLSYQWYSNTGNHTEDGNIISGATSSSFQPPVSIDKWYYCVVTNTKNSTTASTISNTAYVEFMEYVNWVDMSNGAATYQTISVYLSSPYRPGNFLVSDVDFKMGFHYGDNWISPKTGTFTSTGATLSSYAGGYGESKLMFKVKAVLSHELRIGTNSDTKLKYKHQYVSTTSYPDMTIDQKNRYAGSMGVYSEIKQNGIVTNTTMSYDEGYAYIDRSALTTNVDADMDILYKSNGNIVGTNTTLIYVYVYDYPHLTPKISESDPTLYVGTSSTGYTEYTGSSKVLNLKLVDDIPYPPSSYLSQNIDFHISKLVARNFEGTSTTTSYDRTLEKSVTISGKTENVVTTHGVTVDTANLSGLEYQFRIRRGATSVYATKFVVYYNRDISGADMITVSQAEQIQINMLKCDIQYSDNSYTSYVDATTITTNWYNLTGNTQTLNGLNGGKAIKGIRIQASISNTNASNPGVVVNYMVTAKGSGGSTSKFTTADSMPNTSQLITQSNSPFSATTFIPVSKFTVSPTDGGILNFKIYLARNEVPDDK